MNRNTIDIAVTLPVRVTYSYDTIIVKSYYDSSDECPIEIEDIEIILTDDLNNTTTTDFSKAIEKNTTEYAKLFDHITERLTQSFLSAKHDMKNEGI